MDNQDVQQVIRWAKKMTEVRKWTWIKYDINILEIFSLKRQLFCWRRGWLLKRMTNVLYQSLFDWLLFNVTWAIFQAYSRRSKIKLICLPGSHVISISISLFFFFSSESFILCTKLLYLLICRSSSSDSLLTSPRSRPPNGPATNLVDFFNAF
jgi:hypothetical protein